VVVVVVFFLLDIYICVSVCAILVGIVVIFIELKLRLISMLMTVTVAVVMLACRQVFLCFRHCSLSIVIDGVRGGNVERGTCCLCCPGCRCLGEPVACRGIPICTPFTPVIHDE
jgi:hypothetical protein